MLGKPTKTRPSEGDASPLRRGIQVKHEDGEEGELLFWTDHLFPSQSLAFGFRQETNGYSLPICIDENLADTLDDISIHLGEQLGEGMDTEKISPVYRGERDSVVYARVIMSRGGMIYSYIHDEQRNRIDESTMIGLHIKARAVLKVDSLYVGEKAKVQVSLVEAEVKEANLVFESLL